MKAGSGACTWLLRGVLARIEGGVGKGETVSLVGFGRF
jgi:nucleoid DNA-binding protein